MPETPTRTSRGIGVEPTTVDACRHVVRHEAFRPPDAGRPWRLGVEVEVLVLDRESRRPVPPLAEPGSAATLASAPHVGTWASDRGWHRRTGGHGLPVWVGPGGATLSYEPGGQLEYASAPFARVGDLVVEMEDAMGSLSAHLDEAGVELLARGIDPHTPLDEAPMYLAGERYLRQAAHYHKGGLWGRRMMRQSAALHLNVDAPGSGLEGWRLCNAVAPVLLALFANSPVVEGSESGWRSARSAQWRRLDPTRTGIFAGTDDDPERYAERALDADAFLLGGADEAARPFRAWLEEGRVGLPEWRAHLTTFFPEVRARGYMELRSVDTLPLRWLAVPLLVMTGLLRDATSRREALDFLAPPSVEGLVAAGRGGVRDEALRVSGAALLDVAVSGLRRLGSAEVPGALVDRVRDFGDAFTRRGRDPGDEPDDRFA